MASSMYHIGKDGELYVSDGYETRKVAAPATPEPPPNLIYRGTLSEEDRAELRKPATTEPSEWKGSPRRCKQVEMTGAHMRRNWSHEVCLFCGASETDVVERGERMFTPAEFPDPSPADRALEDFTARRKAKREVSAAALPDPPCRYCGMLAGAHREDCNRPDPPPWRYYPRDCSDLSRAMSTPLPHHPPMSARLMPWRNK